jgi:hypothetical protein
MKTVIINRSLILLFGKKCQKVENLYHSKFIASFNGLLMA